MNFFVHHGRYSGENMFPIEMLQPYSIDFVALLFLLHTTVCVGMSVVKCGIILADSGCKDEITIVFTCFVWKEATKT